MFVVCGVVDQYGDWFVCGGGFVYVGVQLGYVGDVIGQEQWGVFGFFGYFGYEG